MPLPANPGSVDVALYALRCSGGAGGPQQAQQGVVLADHHVADRPLRGGRPLLPRRRLAAPAAGQLRSHGPRNRLLVVGGRSS